MSAEVVIAAAGLGKAYAIFRRPEHRLWQMFWRNRRRFFTEYWALQGIDLEIRRGETIGIVGRNGSGKSTLLQLISGTLAPTCGRLTVHGRVSALLELGAGFNPEFTGRENVFLSAAVLGLTSQQIEERYAAILDFAGIGDFIHQPVKFYSSGMYARLAFAVAAHVDADILIVDETLAVGDVAFVQKCMRFIRAFRERGTLLFVSHDATAVINLCERVIWLDRGNIRQSGPAQEVCHAYHASLYHEQDESNAFRIGGSRKRLPEPTKVVTDPRDELLRTSALRNEIEVFDFDPSAPWFGQRGATINAVELLGPDHQPLTTFIGGEEVSLRITGHAERDLQRPIIGFYVKDRLGQNLFGDNTYLTYRTVPLPVGADQTFAATFRFQLPYLPTGDYSVIASIAEGTQEEHIQHHWIDDALFFRVNSSHVVRGLIGIPMLDISFERYPEVRPTTPSLLS